MFYRQLKKHTPYVISLPYSQKYAVFFWATLNWMRMPHSLYNYRMIFNKFRNISKNKFIKINIFAVEILNFCRVWKASSAKIFAKKFHKIHEFQLITSKNYFSERNMLAFKLEFRTSKNPFLILCRKNIQDIPEIFTDIRKKLD